MLSNARGNHVAPGIYTKEIDLTYAAKSLGITTLGVAGETLKGPAFEPVSISNWNEFTEYFGETSTELFGDTKYPKYELPYIAKSYLNQSKQLEVCRILGLSGYNAGPAWILTASKDGRSDATYPIAILRSKGYYKKFTRIGNDSDDCSADVYLYDRLKFYATADGDAELSGYEDVKLTLNNCGNAVGESTTTSSSFVEVSLTDSSISESKKSFYHLNYSEISEASWVYDGTELTQTSASFFTRDDDGNYEWVDVDTEAGRNAASGKTIYSAWTRNVFEYIADLSNAETSDLYLAEDASGNLVAPHKVSGDTKERTKMIKVTSNDIEIAAAAPLVFVKSPSGVTTEYYLVGDKQVGYNLELDGKSLYVESGGTYTETAYTAITTSQWSSVYAKYDIMDDAKENYYRVMTRTELVESTYGLTSAYLKVETTTKQFPINSDNLGQFSIVINGTTVPISLNPGSKEYILDVLGTSPNDGGYDLFVEELYDVALSQLVDEMKVNQIDGKLQYYNNNIICPVGDPVKGLLRMSNEELKYTYIGQRYLADKEASEDPTISCYIASGDTYVSGGSVTIGSVYTIKRINIDGTKIYTYLKDNDTVLTSGGTYSESGNTTGQVYVEEEDRYYMLGQKDGDDIVAVTCDLNNYKEQFRCASTPWIVSELKGDGKSVEMKKLFRFHTISDGNAANTQVKISIQNIRPEEGTFDVVIRDYDDTDSNIVSLERYTKCTMIPGTTGYIGLKIGTTDGAYETKSKYVTVEVIENDITETCVPCGFLGYPLRYFSGVQVDGNSVEMKQPYLEYNTMVQDDIKVKKQYFGLSNIVGVDSDVFNYKGVEAYKNKNSLSNGFHLDARIDNMNQKEYGDYVYTVDGETGYTLTSVSRNNGDAGYGIPIIGMEEDMENTIYEDINLRKFTVYPYGGFDGWDIYREKRTNTDEYKVNKYKGKITNGEGENFRQITDGTGLGLDTPAISSDYYAYLAGYKQFSNPEAVDINVFATPGIDFVNQPLLVADALDMIEEERGDSIYIMTTPDKPAGSSDIVDDMYLPEEVVEFLEDAGIDSSFCATYYPWVKYYDSTNAKYIYLPPTKDVVRNIAETDNSYYPWYAPAGINRGNVDCVRAHYVTKLADEDTLYEGRINYIKTFAEDGVKVWGNKTTLDTDGALNRINVRRLMLRVRKLIIAACRRLIFEPNDDTVVTQFKSLVEPILKDVKEKRGIYDYKLEVDDSAEARDRLELPAAIHIKPTKALEYIDLTFVITPDSVSFDE